MEDLMMMYEKMLKT